MYYLLYSPHFYNCKIKVCLMTLESIFKKETQEFTFDISHISSYPFFEFESNNPNIKCCDPQCAYDVFNYLYTNSDQNKLHIKTNIEVGKCHRYLTISIQMDYNPCYEFIYIEMPNMDKLYNKKWHIKIFDITNQMQNSLSLFKNYRVKIIAE